MSQQRTSRAEFTRKAGTLGDLAAKDEVPSAGTYPSSAARNTLDKRVALFSRVEMSAARSVNTSRARRTRRSTS